MPTLYELKQSLGMIGQQLKIKWWIESESNRPKYWYGRHQTTRNRKAGLQQRFNIVERQVKDIEEKKSES